MFNYILQLHVNRLKNLFKFIIRSNLCFECTEIDMDKCLSIKGDVCELTVTENNSFSITRIYVGTHYIYIYVYMHIYIYDILFITFSKSFFI